MLIKFRYLNTVPVMTLVINTRDINDFEKATCLYYGYSLLWLVSVFDGATNFIRSE